MAQVVNDKVVGDILYSDILNVETYITADEMLEYLSSHRVSSDTLRVQWEAMDIEDQEILLHRAYLQINSLPYTGRKSSATQREPFPRGTVFTPADLQTIKYAQAEQALALSDTVAAQETEQRAVLRRAGVVQYTIGDLSETFGNSSACSNANYFGLSKNAYGYLSRWLQGGYGICTSIKKPSGHL